MMQRLILIFIITISFCDIFAQNFFANLTDIEAKKMICHKWKLISLEAKNKKIDVPKKAPTVSLTFLSDGKLIESAGNKEFNGTWSYNHTTKTLTTNDQDGKEDQKILNITNETFVMQSKIKGIIVNLWLQRID